MKKVFALLASLSFLNGCILSVSAENVNQKDTDIYTVIGIDSDSKGNTYYLSHYQNGVFQNDAFLSDFELQAYEQKTPLQYGDIVTVCGSSSEGGEFRVNTFHLSKENPEDEVHFIDSAESYFGKTEELTISGIENKTLILENNNGKSCQYSYSSFDNMQGFINQAKSKYYQFESLVDSQKFAVGQTWNFIMNGEEAVLPLELVSSDIPNGDADGNGTLDILDVISVNKAVLGKEELDPERIPHVDFNSNGVPDSDDALTMLKKIVGLA